MTNYLVKHLNIEYKDLFLYKEKENSEDKYIDQIIKEKDNQNKSNKNNITLIKCHQKPLTIKNNPNFRIEVCDIFGIKQEDNIMFCHVKNLMNKYGTKSSYNGASISRLSSQSFFIT
ncbi:hypothetical protein AshY1_05020 [Candidatus Phytoplasma fraxini]|uniref:Uncharacterized protein n=2 Tax=Ash yellows phytoplasma TaxID=35780 RepID=A0ABZ2UCX8_ASHYP